MKNKALLNDTMIPKRSARVIQPFRDRSRALFGNAKNKTLWLQLARSLVMSYLVTISSVQAQIVPDNTLPMNSSIAPGGCGADCAVIEGGTVRGVNLYHSFREFSIPTGGEAFFNNGLQIQTILTRVAGTSLSNIDGLIRANGTASLFLLNPNGIVFGPNARLQLGGSFTATTANRFTFSDGSEFSAVNPQAPPLLTVNVLPGTQFGARPSGSSIRNAGNLAVPTGQNITLLGSTTISRGTLTAPGGTVKVLGDRVALLDNARIDVSSPAGGGTVLVGGDYKGQGTLPHAVQTYVVPTVVLNADATTYGNGGRVIVWADDTTRFDGTISARGGAQGGNGGFVEVSGAKNLAFNGLVNTSAPSGNMGTLLLDPANLKVDQTNGTNFATLLNTNALVLEATDTISFEDVDLTANSPNTLTLRAETINLLRASIEQIGGGNIILEATKAIAINGLNDSTAPEFVNSNRPLQGLKLSRSGLYNTVTSTTLGKGGNITINVPQGSLSVLNGALISASTEGGADAGNVTIHADTIILDGVRKSLNGNAIQTSTINCPFGIPCLPTIALLGETQLRALIESAEKTTKFQIPGGVTSLVLPGALGNGGTIDITSGDLKVTGGAQLSAITYGKGHPGNVTTIASRSAAFEGTAKKTPEFILGATNSTTTCQFLSGALLGCSTRSTSSTAQSADSLRPPSGASASIRAGANVTDGIRGDVTINTSLLEVKDGARITASTSAQGDAGDVKIRANSVSLSGAGPNAKTPGEARADEFPGGISVLTQAQTDSAGNSVKGNGGSITINTQTLQASDGTVIQSLTRGNGNAGNVRINATDSAVFDRSFLISEVQANGVGNGGGIDITTGALSLSNGAQLRASTSGQGNAGDVSVRESKTVDLFTNSVISTAANAGAIGQGGNVTIQTGLFSLNGKAQIIASTASQGRAGNVEIAANELEASSQGKILTTTSSSGEAGNITLKVSDRVSLSDLGTAILANTTKLSSGRGGNILIDPSIVEIKQGARIAVDSAGTNQGGNITITAGKLTLDNGSVTAETASSQGGNITLNAGNLLVLRHNSLISATAGTDQAGGNGGNVILTTPFVLGVLAENSDIRANAFRGNGGNITINANQVFGLRSQSQNTPFSDITASSQLGISGNIILNTLNLDPSQGLQELNLAPVDPSKLVAQGCNSGRKVVEGQSKFVVLGRGGLIASPDDPFGGTAVLNDLGSPTDSPATAARVSLPSQATSTAAAPMAEAQGWAKDSDGKMYLVSQSASAPVEGTQPSPLQCQPR